MTAEVAILNADGVVLAADSAVTVDALDGRKAIPRANKIFALSDVHPVAVMFHGSARFMGVPWETLIKEYRTERGSKHLPRVSDHAVDFLTWLAESAPRFPAGEFEYALDALVQFHTESFVREIKRRLRDDAQDARAVRRAAEDVLAQERQRLARDVSDEIVGATIARYEANVEQRMNATLERIPLTKSQRNELLAMILGRVFGRLGHDNPMRAGLVFAGFGHAQWLPQVDRREVGLLLPEGHLQSAAIDTHEIGSETTAWIVPIANADEIRAFLNGIHPIFRSTLLTQQRLKPARDKGKGRPGSAMLDEISSQLFTDRITEMTALMPRDELAVMAETLVNLCAFRQRLSGQIETVSGPVDVAVISRGDGLVWLKRKHYFPVELNSQYFQRRAAPRRPT